nr:hypothetical protein [Pseudobdellovibrionaceae bacterium]
MKFSFIVVLLASIASSKVWAAGSNQFGFNVGIGAPFLSQYGLNYKMGDKFSFSAALNQLDFTLGTASLKLTMPEVLLHYHPFGGSFFLAVGAGQETLQTKA